MQENSTIKRNILHFLDFKGVTAYRFYKETGITRGILTQNNGMSEDNTLRFLDYYPEVNAQWLLTGEGKMLKSGSSGVDNEEVLAENARLKERVKSLEEMKQLQQELITSLKQQLGNAHAHSSKAS